MHLHFSFFHLSQEMQDTVVQLLVKQYKSEDAIKSNKL